MDTYIKNAANTGFPIFFLKSNIIIPMKCNIDELTKELDNIAQKNNISPSTIAFAFMKAVWAEEKDISNEETVKEICQHCNINSTSIIEEANSAEINNQYVRNTNEAINKNVWGSPTFIYNNELFWGQDRIEFLERAIQNN